MMAHEIIDCKLQIRSYVLVPLPSRWIRSGERVIIHSPVQDISTSPENIPAKRYCHGEEQHAVCFMKPSDIEKETSVIYEELCISPSLSWVNAHGVALRSSSCSSPFKYQRGDRFWIHIGSNTNGFDSSVPVINLQTFESGVIAVDHVCWYPHLRGANEELYTLGGDVRKLKQCGSRKFSYWSWVICQSLNSTPSTTKSIEVPAEGARLKDRWPLALEESQDLFEKKCRYMEQCLRGPTERSVWLTPPPTFPTRWEASTPGVKRKGYEQARRTPSAGPTPPKYVEYCPYFHIYVWPNSSELSGTQLLNLPHFPWNQILICQIEHLRHPGKNAQRGNGRASNTAETVESNLPRQTNRRHP